MMFLAQIPGADEAIKAAAREGWVVVLLVVIVLSVVALAGYLVHRILADASTREERLAARVSHLEEYIEETLMSTLKETSAALVASTVAIERLTRVIEKCEAATGHKMI